MQHYKAQGSAVTLLFGQYETLNGSGTLIEQSEAMFSLKLKDENFFQQAREPVE